MEVVKTTDNDKERALKRRSKMTYLAVSIGVAVLFAAAALLRHYATAVAFEAAAWAFLLSMIVSMPLASSYWKHRSPRRE
jgi:O-antigen/teichoic acid export membrane protein